MVRENTLAGIASVTKVSKKWGHPVATRLGE